MPRSLSSRVTAATSSRRLLSVLAMTCLLSALERGDGVGEREEAPRLLDMKPLDEPPIDQRHAAPRADRGVVRLDNFPRRHEVLRRRPEDAVGGVDGLGM